MFDTVIEHIEIENKLNSIVEVIPCELGAHWSFSLAFAYFFLKDTPDYQLQTNLNGATGSN